LLITLELSRTKELDWNKTYSSYDNIPFGTSVLYDLADSIFPNKSVSRINESFYRYSQASVNNTNILFIAKDAYFDDQSRNEILNYVKSGNEIFISADFVDPELLEKLQVDINSSGLKLMDDLIEYHSIDEIKIATDTSLQLVNFDLYYYFDSLPDSGIEVLGEVNSKPNFIKVDYGDGSVFIHLKPLLFTNYYLLKNISTDYVERVFLKLSNKPIIWDDYLNYGDRKTTTPLRVILKSEGFKYAYFTSIALLILFVLFAGKRKQKAIPVIEPLENKSTEFIDTITNLYLSSKNHKYIVKHQINAFKLHIKNKYFINWQSMDSNQLIRLSKKSNIPLDSINRLRELIDNMENKTKINQTEFVNLINSIQQFINKTYGRK